jgi:hypothetical protein
MYVRANEDLLRFGMRPCILGKIETKINWYTEIFWMRKPECLIGCDYNVILYSHKFTKGIAFGNMVDFDEVIE